MITAIIFICPTCSKVKMISVLDPDRKDSTEIKKEWVDMIQSGYDVRNVSLEEARVSKMCYTNHE